MESLTLNLDVTDADLLALGERMDGEIAVPSDERWDAARQAWNLAVQQHPRAVALPETAEDVVAVVDFARDNGLRVAAQGTGHNAGPLGSLEDTILVKTERMRGVEIDAEAQIARVEAGVLWAEAATAAAQHGLAALAGSSPDVGVVGYTVGGGMSWLARKHGLAANSVTAVELVTADGRLVRADRDNDPDLYWALRGGGGSFGVVTALEFRLYPIENVYAGILWWPIERASEVLQAWHALTELDVPDELTTVGRLLQFPPIPGLPDIIRGKSFVVVEAIYLGDPAEGDAWLASLRDLEPAMDTMAVTPAQQLHKLHMDPEHPVPGAADGMLLAELPAEAIDAVSEIVPGSSLLSVEFRHLGGALGRPSADHGALSSINAEYAMFAVGITPTPESKPVVEADIEVVQEALADWEANHMYLNFSEKRMDARSFFTESAYRRLRRIKAAVDPTDMIRANHSVTPA